MGSGRETAFEDGLGSFDARDGVRFRHVATGASLDLRDLGAGAWRATVTAAAPGVPRPLPLVDAGDGLMEGTLGPEWSTHEIVARAPWGWRSGLTFAFPGSRRDDLWLREVRIDRGRAWPSVRIVTCVIAAGLLLALALRASGLGGRAAWAGAAAFVVCEAAAIAADPAAALPHAPHLVAIVLLGAIVTALARSLLALPPAAVAAGGVGFMAWLAATTAPLYRGGHFVFHSSIAEEIWKGRFLLYYLPYPGQHAEPASAVGKRDRAASRPVPHAGRAPGRVATRRVLRRGEGAAGAPPRRDGVGVGRARRAPRTARGGGSGGHPHGGHARVVPAPRTRSPDDDPRMLGHDHGRGLPGPELGAPGRAVPLVAGRAAAGALLPLLFRGTAVHVDGDRDRRGRAPPKTAGIRPRAPDRGSGGGGAGLRGLLRELDVAVPLRVGHPAPDVDPARNRPRTRAPGARG